MPNEPITFDAAEAGEVVRALAAVAAADGAVKAREEQFLEGFAMRHGHTYAAHLWLSQPLDTTTLAAVIDGADKRREVLRLCLEMALADRDFAEAERQMIERIAVAFAIPAAELDALVESERARRERAATSR
jgi:uncharacterized membrane protein YebE (DUF533 family)